MAAGSDSGVRPPTISTCPPSTVIVPVRATASTSSRM